MSKPSKPPEPERARPVAEIRRTLGSAEPAGQEGSIGEFWALLPQVEPILTALVRDLNNDHEDIRYQAAKGLLLAFPTAEAALAGPMRNIESHDQKVRLAAIEHVIMILAKALCGFAGLERSGSATSGSHADQFKEDFMEHAGRWVAWTRDRQRMVAVADSFADVMAQALEAGEPEPYVTKTPGVSPTSVRKPLAILEGESPDVLEDVRKLFAHPESWLDTPNESLGGEKPCDLVGTEREREVRYLLRGIEDGITT